MPEKKRALDRHATFLTKCFGPMKQKLNCSATTTPDTFRGEEKKSRAFEIKNTLPTVKDKGSSFMICVAASGMRNIEWVEERMESTTVSI